MRTPEGATAYLAAAALFVGLAAARAGFRLLADMLRRHRRLHAPIIRIAWSVTSEDVPMYGVTGIDSEPVNAIDLVRWARRRRRALLKARDAGVRRQEVARSQEDERHRKDAP